AMAPVAGTAAAMGASTAAAAKIGAAASFVAPAALGYMIGAGASYDEALQRGLSEEEAMAAANLTAPAYILEAVPVTSWLKALPAPAKQEVLRAGRALATRTLREALKDPMVRRVVGGVIASSAGGAGEEAVQEYMSAWHQETVIGALEDPSQTYIESAARAATDPAVI